MERNGIFAYTDEGLKGGEHISTTLFNKISESQVSVAVFSPNYANSPWCLDELVQITQCKRDKGQTLLPVFLQGVKPTHVRHQTGPFGDGFEQLIARGPPYISKKEIWRHALEQAANLSSGAFDHSSEATIVNQLVNKILSILGQMSSPDYRRGFFGTQTIKEVESILFSQVVSSIGVWGMGGSGKTTIAKKIIAHSSNNFDRVCFIEDVREHAERGKLKHLQEYLLYQLFGISQLNEPPHIIYNSHIIFRLSRISVLIILDDVSDASQVEFVIGNWKNYSKGSKMIATSRDRQVLRNICDVIYEVQMLDDRDSLQLLKHYMFKQRQPTLEQMELLQQTIKYAQGLPLALIVLGRNLYDKDINIWRSELAKLNEFPISGIMNILRISFDRLEKIEKNIFLDTACLLHSWDGDRIEIVLSAHGFCPISSIDCLVDKALITISSNKRLQMHDLLRQMGNEINKDRRYWRCKEIADVLSKNVETSRKRKIEVISSSKWSKAKRIKLKPNVFKKMSSLRILRLLDIFGRNILLPRGLKYLPDELRCLAWHEYPYPSLPMQFDPKNLVEFQMRFSKVNQLWCGEPWLPNLKCMDLTGSRMLTKLPNLSGALKLEELQATDCDNLVKIPNSIRNSVELKYLSFSGCSSITKLPQLPPNLLGLYLSRTKIEELPPGIEDLSRLTLLCCWGCRELKSLPSNVGELEHLTWLDISECSKLRSLPKSVGDSQYLVVIYNKTGLSDLRTAKFLISLAPIWRAYVKALSILPI